MVSEGFFSLFGMKAILGRDYTNARGTTSGVIPAFDSNADLNHDGYLNRL